MSDTKERLLPGAALTYDDSGEKGFSKIEMLISATGGLSLSQVCAVTGLEGSTIQNWVKRGWVPNPRGKKYDDIHVARILIINALKECIKLEHISLLMKYVNEAPADSSDENVKESDLFNFLCDALEILGQADDRANGGVESVVETVIQDHRDAPFYEKIRKALAVMIYACVCTDVKRRTEAMMTEILTERENPKVAEAPVPPIINAEPEEAVTIQEKDTASEPQFDALPKESVEEAETTLSEPSSPPPPKAANKPWYFRKGTGEDAKAEESQVTQISNEELEAANTTQESAIDAEASSDAPSEDSAERTEAALNDPAPSPPPKAANKPWYFRKGPKT